MRWITATRLVQWADNRTAEGDLPLLIRKLIVASVREWPGLHIPAGDSIFKPGWDGLCQSATKARLVPAGRSCWEWGRTGDYRGKLTEDFEKRTLATPPEKQTQQTFVFVTPRRWVSSKSEVIDDLKSRSQWKDILIYDADDLELWLEHCPAVGRWLALELQVITEGVSSAEEFWKNYTGQPEYVFAPEFIVGGRTATAERVLNFLSDESDTLEIQASSKDEGAAFVIAAMLRANPGCEELVYSKSVLVSDPVCLKQVNELQEGLLIIYLPVKDEVITMLGNFSKELIAIGIDSREAHHLTKICGRSYDVLRRMLTDQAGRVYWPAGYDP